MRFRFLAARARPKQWFCQFYQPYLNSKLPLRLVLTVPFVLLIVTTTGLVGYLSWQNGQRSVNHVASALLAEVSQHVTETLNTFLSAPHQITASNANAVELGQLNPRDFNQLGQHFFRQLDLYPNITSIVYANERGEMIGYRHDGSSKEMTIATSAEPGVRYHYRLDDRGKRTQLTRILRNDDPRVWPWYRGAPQKNQAAWSPIYPWSISPDFVITAMHPIAAPDKAFAGVFAVDILLRDINHYLRNLADAQTGQIFIVEPGGELVATSTAASPFEASTTGQPSQRVQVLHSRDPVTQAVARQLIQQFGSFDRIPPAQQISLTIPSQGTLFAQVTRLDADGLRWFVVTVMPESRFMGEILANTSTIILLSAVALLGAVAIGHLLTQSLVRPMQQLGRASSTLAAGDWAQANWQDSSIAELHVLHLSFIQMAEQLQHTFDRVTIALQESEAKFAKVFRTCPEAISIVTLDGYCVDVNDAVFAQFGYSRAEMVGRPISQFGYWANPAAQDCDWPVLQTGEPGEPIRNRELVVRHKSGKQLTVLLSADRIELHGQPHIIAVTTNISDRKQFETALQESEERFREIAETINQFFFIRSADFGQFLYVSPAYETLFGRTRESLYQNPASLEALHPDDRELVSDSLTQQVQGHTIQREYRIIRPDGSIRWIVAYISPIFDQHQQLLRYVGLAEDITDRKQAELELRQQKDLRETIYNEATDALFLVDPETLLITDCNRRAVELFEASSAADLIGIEGRTLQQRPFSAEEVAAIVTEMAEKGFWSREIEYVTCKGNLFWGNLAAKPIQIADQAVHLVRVTDISDRKQAEEALRQSEAYKRAILTAIPDLMKLYSVAGTYLASVKSGATFDLIADDAELIGKHISELVPLDIAIQELHLIQQAVATKEVQVYEQQIWLHNTLRYEEIRAVPCSEDTALLLIRDISARKQAEEALRESEERFRSAFHNAPIGMGLIGTDDRWLKVNPMLCNLLGYLESELLSKRMSSLVHPEDLNLLQHCIEQALSNLQGTAQVELRYQCQGGRIVWGKLSLSVVRDAHKQPVYYVAQSQDITEQYAIDRMKDEFISIVSHELRTPLTAIQGFLGLLSTGLYDNKPEKAKRMLNLALTNSDRLVRLVNDILDLERLSSGKVQLMMERCTAEDLLQRAVEGVQSLADQAAITLAIVPTSAQVWAEPDAIIQTLTNLLSNAIKFSPPHTTVRLSAQTQTDSVLFQVQDRGRGIPSDKLGTIFGRFQQVDVSDSRQKGGTGLGLAICQSIVQQHGGNIWVESTIGAGSTFCFTLPTPSDGNDAATNSSD